MSQIEIPTAAQEPVIHGKKRRGRPSKLVTLMEETPALYARMLGLIRAGAFGWIAAQSIGIAPETFSRWLTRGQLERRGHFRQFRQDVLQAAAQARVIAEVKVYRDNPMAWLRFGPGRTTAGRPGWTDSACVLMPENESPEMRPLPKPNNPPEARADLTGILSALAEAGHLFAPISKEGCPPTGQNVVALLESSPSPAA